MAAEGFEQLLPCGLVIEINDSCKDTIVTGMKRLFKLSDLLGLFLNQSADNWMSIAERCNGRQAQGLLRERGGGAAHKARGFRRYDPSYTPLSNTQQHHRNRSLRSARLSAHLKFETGAGFAAARLHC